MNRGKRLIYNSIYNTPFEFDDIIMSSDGTYLTGLYFKNSKNIDNLNILNNLAIFEETSKWLDIYFSGIIPKFIPKYNIDNLTDFRKDVLEIIKKIPYGKVITYKDIAKKIEKKRKIDKMSAQAVGNAVAWNPICIIIPCHRVLGTNNSLTGYNGGLKNKEALLKLEGHNLNRFKISKKG